MSTTNDKFLEEVAHVHQFEFFDFNGAESTFRCIVEVNGKRCSVITDEPEDSGTGA